MRSSATFTSEMFRPDLRTDGIQEPPHRGQARWTILNHEYERRSAREDGILVRMQSPGIRQVNSAPNLFWFVCFTHEIHPVGVGCESAREETLRARTPVTRADRATVVLAAGKSNCAIACCPIAFASGSDCIDTVDTIIPKDSREDQEMGNLQRNEKMRVMQLPVPKVFG